MPAEARHWWGRDRAIVDHVNISFPVKQNTFMGDGVANPNP